jgi:hypothetical protein
MGGREAGSRTVPESARGFGGVCVSCISHAFRCADRYLSQHRGRCNLECMRARVHDLMLPGERGKSITAGPCNAFCWCPLRSSQQQRASRGSAGSSFLRSEVYQYALCH